MAGIYQSRVFNFIGGHTNRVRNGLAQGWRQVKISVQWTGQILLAPLRWLQRFSQNPDRQIAGHDRSQLPMGKEPLPATSSQSALAPLNAATANQAIEHLLAEVVAAGHGLLPASALAQSTYEDWSVIDEQDWDTSLLDESNLSLAGTSAALSPARPIIQGLATLLSNGNLVLIDRHNQVLDVLSPSQQFHLRQQIDPASARALNAAAPRFSPQTTPALDQTTISAVRSSPSPEIVVLPPSDEVPQTLWQKIRYWGKFYAEYLQIDVGTPQSPTPPRLLPPTLKLPFPFQKSMAVIPKSIATLTAPSKSTPTQPTPSNADDDINASLQLTIDTTSQQPAVSTIGASAKQGEDLTAVTTKPLAAPSAKSQTQSQVTFQPPWIDTPIEDLGYERSLWRQLWEWLDRLMLAIENWLINLYQRLKGEG